MSYIGRKPTVGNFQICDAISVVNGQAAYTMQVGSVNVIPQSANHMIVSLNGTIQKPNSSFTVSGSTITFASNLATGDVIDFIQILGDVLDLGVPSDATVTAAKLGANSVTAAKLNNDIISGSTELASEPADTDEFLVSDAGTLKRIDYSLIKGGGLSMFRQWRISASNSGLNAGDIISANWEEVDNSWYEGFGTNVSQSSGTFSFGETGKYLIEAHVQFQDATEQAYVGAYVQTTTDNSSYSSDIQLIQHLKLINNHNTYGSAHGNFIFDVQNTTNYKIRLVCTGENNGINFNGSSTRNDTYLTFLKIGDT